MTATAEHPAPSSYTESAPDGKLDVCVPVVVTGSSITLPGMLKVDDVSKSGVRENEDAVQFDKPPIPNTVHRN